MSSFPSDNSDIPSALAPIAAHARPARIVTFDIDGDVPELRADSQYQNAWVVLTAGGVPRKMVMLDLSEGEEAVRSRLELLSSTLRATSAELGPKASVRDEDLPKISVVVPTIVGRVEDLGRCIDAIGQLEYPDFEVILVDNRRVLPEEDPLPGLVAARPWLRVIAERRPGISAARNAGVSASTGDIVTFTDDDVRVDPGWLRAIGARFAAEPELEALTGLIVPTELETPSQIWFERYFGGFGSERTFAPVTLDLAPVASWLRGSQVRVCDAGGAELRRFSIYGVGAYGAGANMSFRRSTLDRIGGFDVILGVGTPAPGGEDLVALVDTLWSGGKIGYEPAAFVHHRHRREYSELLRQIDGYGLGFTAMLVSLVRREPRHLVCIASQLPRALKWKALQGVERLRRGKKTVLAAPSAPLYPSVLFQREIWAFCRGPWAYVKSLKKWHEVSAQAQRSA